MTRSLVSFASDLTPAQHGVPGVPEWPSYASHTDGVNFVFSRDGSYLETDDFRKSGIATLINNPLELLH